MTQSDAPSRSLARGVEAALRAAIVAVLAIGIRRRDPGAVINAVFALAGSFGPNVVERLTPVSFHPWQRLYVDSAMLAHAVGMLGPYDDCWWWDHLTHVQSATLVGSSAFVAARRLGADPFKPVLATVTGAGLLWEAVEYLVHWTSHRVGFDPVLVSYGPVDTALDLVFDLIGALVVLLVGETLLENLLSTERD